MSTCKSQKEQIPKNNVFFGMDDSSYRLNFGLSKKNEIQQHS